MKNSGALTFPVPKDLLRPVEGKLYLFLYLLVGLPSITLVSCCMPDITHTVLAYDKITLVMSAAHIYLLIFNLIQYFLIMLTLSNQH